MKKKINKFNFGPTPYEIYSNLINNNIIDKFTSEKIKKDLISVDTYLYACIKILFILDQEYNTLIIPVLNRYISNLIYEYSILTSLAINSTDEEYLAFIDKIIEVQETISDNISFSNTIIINTPFIFRNYNYEILTEYSNMSINRQLIVHKYCEFNNVWITNKSSLEIINNRYNISREYHYSINYIKRCIKMIQYKCIHLLYKPEGIGYYLTKSHFESLLTLK